MWQIVHIPASPIPADFQYFSVQTITSTAAHCCEYVDATRNTCSPIVQNKPGSYKAVRSLNRATAMSSYTGRESVAFLEDQSPVNLQTFL